MSGASEVDLLVKAVQGYVDRGLDGVHDRIDELVARIAAVETQSKGGYRGIWSASEDYAVGDQCTHGGSLWVAMSEGRNAKPGTGVQWKLAVKRGRAA